MQCKDLELVLESEGLGALSLEAREHLTECPDCQGLLADLHSIVAVASTLPAEVAPPARVWTSLRAQLEAEGLIKEPAKTPQAAPWWESLRALFQIRSFAAVGAAFLLIAGTIFFTHKTGQPLASQVPATPVAQPQKAAASTAAQVAPDSSSPAPQTGMSSTAKPRREAPVRSGARELAPSPSETASSTLTQAELSFPDMQLAGNARVDASFRQNLQTLNQFIAECERHLKENPQDELAREYLNMAYQQKADLLAAMMENSRSEH